MGPGRLARAAAQADLRPREVALLNHVAQGRSYAQIAESSGYAVGTVRDHMAVVRAKLGARNLAHAVHLAWQTGVLT